MLRAPPLQHHRFSPSYTHKTGIFSTGWKVASIQLKRQVQLFHSWEAHFLSFLLLLTLEVYINFRLLTNLISDDLWTVFSIYKKKKKKKMIWTDVIMFVLHCSSFRASKFSASRSIISKHNESTLPLIFPTGQYIFEIRAIFTISLGFMNSSKHLWRKLIETMKITKMIRRRKLFLREAKAQATEDAEQMTMRKTRNLRKPTSLVRSSNSRSS